MTTSQIDKLIERGQITTEIELEQALVADKKLRILVKSNPELASKRSTLRNIIQNYESKHWTDLSSISLEQIEQSNKAEEIVEKQEDFLCKRKQLIKKALKNKGLTQQDLGKILDHPNKSYMSQLMNGLARFQINDLILIHRILDIDLTNLIPSSIPEVKIRKALEEIRQMNNPNIDESKVLALL